MENVKEISYLVDTVCLGLAGAAALGSLLIAYYFNPVKKERKYSSQERQLEDTLVEYVRKGD